MPSVHTQLDRLPDGAMVERRVVSGEEGRDVIGNDLASDCRLPACPEPDSESALVRPVVGWLVTPSDHPIGETSSSQLLGPFLLHGSERAGRGPGKDAPCKN